ncbi:unnamed protein product [Coffea canephora]|uniref:Uncharacterized protein n=2 Tax=Coffea TaxID=13442 RepID=A0A068TN92_COFCA|nr:uncharacterized protein LOC113739548 [Coffea arabica]CDO97795.1 unnamed protein product [Coffea canephora]
MAVRYSISVSAPIIIQESASRKPASIVMMSAENHISVNSTGSSISTTPFQIRSPTRNKVFEDPSNGIVCYREENGEITCEGIDEGPRLHHLSSRFTAVNQREAEIIDLLERSLLQVVDSDKT